MEQLATRRRADVGASPEPGAKRKRPSGPLKKVAGPIVVMLVFAGMWGAGTNYTPPCSTYPVEFLVDLIPVPGQPHVDLQDGVDRQINTRVWQNGSTGELLNGSGTASFRIELARGDVYTMDAVLTAAWTTGRSSPVVGNWEWTKPDGRTFENLTSVLLAPGSSSSLNLTVTFTPSNHTAPYRHYFLNTFVIACERWTMLTEWRIE